MMIRSVKSRKTKFIYMGDPQCSRLKGNQSDYSLFGKLLGQAEKCLEESSEKLLLLGGDIVNHSNRPQEWAAFFDEIDQFSERRFILATPVNGAVESIGRYRERFLNTGNGPEGYEQDFFSFDFGCCHFLVMNSDYLGNRNEEICGLFRRWISEDLAANIMPVVFAVVHHPFYSMGTSFEDDVRAMSMRDNYLKLLENFGVDYILCGHQHVYSRCTVGEKSDIVQLMGVSGGKYFKANDAAELVFVKEFTSVATVFETDGRMISLKTIDPDGVIIDSLEKEVRAAENISAGRTSESDAFESRFSKCQPVEEIVLSEIVSSKLDKHNVEYSVMQRGKLCYKKKSGYLLRDILREAGIDLDAVLESGRGKTDAVYALILEDRKGKQKVIRLNELIEAYRFYAGSEENDFEKEQVPAIIFEEAGRYRLACGQTEVNQYNARGWAQDVRKIKIVEIGMGKNISR